ncbi:DUF4225 domain-containing protein [Xenorhabdus anantnagensis]|uniref:DUF4225 domain-containing protein n=1 Tax=Xenorhabdus anantnagensis TaxID=3025875 RepID=A0ABT5LT38_9GAMM|nr:DUF4225 domain-containing protein [Xenorhabdus anantnagensis]MDC9597592.1 DUF4225 domain-containing protein [Xenorhabdus anantnagensis]
MAYIQLTEIEIYQIFSLKEAGFTQRLIAFVVISGSRGNELTYPPLTNNQGKYNIYYISLEKIKRQILSVMETDIYDIRYQEHVLQYGNYEQYASVEIRKRSEGLGFYDYVLKGIGLIAGVAQVITGAGIILAGDASVIGAPLGTVAGAWLVLHGVSNTQENLGAIIHDDPGYNGFARIGYEYISESLGYSKKTGSLVYGGVDLALSGYGLFRSTLKEDAWKLFRYINDDYVRGYQLMNGYSLGFEAVADGVTIKSANDMYNDPNYNKK